MKDVGGGQQGEEPPLDRRRQPEGKQIHDGRVQKSGRGAGCGGRSAVDEGTKSRFPLFYPLPERGDRKGRIDPSDRSDGGDSRGEGQENRQEVFRMKPIVHAYPLISGRPTCIRKYGRL